MISTLIKVLLQLYNEDSVPFPRKECWTILAGTGEKFNGFIPDLAMYCMDIAGFIGSVETINRWSDVRLTWAHATGERSFFDKYPEFQELEVRITPVDTPDLYAEIELYEEMRELLLDLISLEIERRKQLFRINQKAPTWRQLRRWRYEFAIDRNWNIQYLGRDGKDI